MPSASQHRNTQEEGETKEMIMQRSKENSEAMGITSPPGFTKSYLKDKQVGPNKEAPFGGRKRKTRRKLTRRKTRRHHKRH